MSSFYQAQEGKKENKTGVLRPAGCPEKLQSLGAVNATYFVLDMVDGLLACSDCQA